MEDFCEERGQAPKIFFVTPDTSIISDTFLEAAFLLGYETYLFTGDSEDLKTRIEVLVGTFTDLILFFILGTDANLVDWVAYLGDLQSRYRSRLRIGVLYENPSPELDSRVKRLFLLEAGLTAGCVCLHAEARRNHLTLFDVLAANQAEGRRRQIRLSCPTFHGVHFPAEADIPDGILLDISVSHFSARFDSRDPGWELGTKVPRVELRFTGNLLIVNALVGLKRCSREATDYVFLFHPQMERPGMDDFARVRVNSLIYRQFRTRNEALLEDRFRAG